MSSSTTTDCTKLTNCRIAKDFEYLRQMDVFSGTPPEVIKLFAYLARHRTYAAGQDIIVRGLGAECAFSLIRGTVEILTIHKNREVILQRLKAGALFGELALLARFTWPFTARAVEESELIIINRESFQKVVEKYPDKRNAMTEKIIQLRITRFEQQTHHMLDRWIEADLHPGEKGNSSIL
jgi:CRP/FNR family transcriptional regulator, cyclic AMP receptor protein